MRFLKWVLFIVFLLLTMGAFIDGEAGIAMVMGLIAFGILRNLRKKAVRRSNGNGVNVDVEFLRPETSADGIVYSTQTRSYRHWIRGHNLMSGNRYRKAENEFRKALASATRPMERYSARLGLIDLYYKQREVRDNAIPQCIEMCKAQIEDTPAIIADFERTWGDAPPAVSGVFERLAIIYEKRGEFGKAIAVCEHGIRLGFDGLAVRRARLAKRITKADDVS